LIQETKRIAEEVEDAGQVIPAVVRNTKRVMASIKMGEINVCDLSGILAGNKNGKDHVRSEM
jgi:hypothetical protein